MCGFLFFVTFSAPFQIAAEPANHAAKYWHGAKRRFNFVNKSLGWCLCVRVCGWVGQKKKCDVHSLTLQYYISTSLTNTACLDIISLNPTHAHTHTHTRDKTSAARFMSSPFEYVRIHNFKHTHTQRWFMRGGRNLSRSEWVGRGRLGYTASKKPLSLSPIFVWPHKDVDSTEPRAASA